MDFQQIFTQVGELISQFGMRILGSIAIFIVGRWIARLMSRFIGRALEKSSLERTLQHFVANVVYYLLLAFIILAALSNIGVETTSFVALLGATGLAVGLAMEGALSNFAAGVMITFFRPIRVGDWISVGDHEGQVEKIQLISTVLITLDNETVILPNSEVTSGTIINYSRQGFVRVEIPITIDHAADYPRVKAILNEAASSSERIIPEPPAEIQIRALDEVGVQLQLEVTVAAKDREDVVFDVSEFIKTKFDEAGIRIPHRWMAVRLENGTKLTA